MTNRELNRDIKRLFKRINKAHYTMDIESYYGFIETVARPEYKRLFYADRTMSSWNAQSHIYMLDINVTHRFIALHNYRRYINNN